MARKEANLNNILFSQDFLPEHWNWTDVEKAHLGNVAEMGEIIKTRLENDGCEIEEMYGILHDKDESKLWNEYTMIYEKKFVFKHVHFVIKFKSGKGNTLAVIANLIGIEPNFVERPRRGRYAYDNMLSYLTHIKYDRKYQYDVHSVCTIVGKDYVKYYRERHEAWVQGRAVKSMNELRKLVDPICYKIVKDGLTLEDIIHHEIYREVYILFPSKIDKTLEKRAYVMGTLQKEEEKRKKQTS